MDPELFEVISLPDGQDVVLTRPDYDPNWVKRGWKELGRGITAGPIALEDITVEKIIGDSNENL